MNRKTTHILLTALISAPSMAHADAQSAAEALPAVVNTVAAKNFSNPDDAAKALLEALASKDNAQLIALFGSQNAELLSSGDDVQDGNNRAEFVALAREKTRMETSGEDKAIVHVGNNDWPFPIPLVKTDGHWHFDAEQGRQEILNRRIGRNELSALAAMRGYVEAQFEYANLDRDGDGVSEYAQKLQSEPGKFDGLFWEVAEGQPQSPLGPLFAEAKAHGYKVREAAEEPVPFHGYYYRILARQGAAAPGGKYDYIINGNMIAGFGMVAFPAQYASSGIMTFVVNHQGKVYQKDLGPKTAELVESIKEYNPDSTWQPFQAQE
ncbi:DUF2950 domain-containing protein [Methylomonas sp. SURF-2]|uniref:DUF2950 domain-containing protein n=1 Tax=Methylomonas subterranea TaxID=2952225 RepID=A0ABT1TAU3_9GAMM|nr:DUF2950 domain-containing protein [Methylomonas sp. SURF-2]MCQ8102584.1 DUF2950 domain-containing protein [Methylomonas sp. SURF-2]